MHAEARLRYSIETWTYQLQDFIEQVIQQPVYLAGNSLGGLLSAHLAATQPKLCRYSLPSLDCNVHQKCTTNKERGAGGGGVTMANS